MDWAAHRTSIEEWLRWLRFLVKSFDLVIYINSLAPEKSGMSCAFEELKPVLRACTGSKSYYSREIIPNYNFWINNEIPQRCTSREICIFFYIVMQKIHVLQTEAVGIFCQYYDSFHMLLW